MLVFMHLDIYIDGGTLGRNPSSEGVYWSVVGTSDGGMNDFAISRRTSKLYTTNNEAEYCALIDALYEIGVRGPLTATIHCDSRMVVEQINGRWKVKNDRLKALHHFATSAVAGLKLNGTEVHIVWVPRAENVERLGH